MIYFNWSECSTKGKAAWVVALTIAGLVSAAWWALFWFAGYLTVGVMGAL